MKIGNFLLGSLVMNGAGSVKLPKHVLEIAKSQSGGVILGSITVDERLGNEGTTYFADSSTSFSLNSKGLPNPGLAYYKKHLPGMVKTAHRFGKPLIVSVAGFSPDEYAHLARTAFEKGADGVELNFGCPNV